MIASVLEILVYLVLGVVYFISQKRKKVQPDWMSIWLLYLIAGMYLVSFQIEKWT